MQTAVSDEVAHHASTRLWLKLLWHTPPIPDYGLAAGHRKNVELVEAELTRSLRMLGGHARAVTAAGKAHSVLDSTRASSGQRERISGNMPLPGLAEFG